MERRINVNMDGESYLKYIESKKLKLSKNTIIGILSLSLSLIGIVGLCMYFTQQPVQSIGFLQSAVLISHSYSGIELIKIGMIIAFPFVVIAWLLHGVQLRLFA